MGEKFNRFKAELGKTFKNLGNATSKTLKSLETPEIKEFDAKMNKVLNQFE